MKKRSNIILVIIFLSAFVGLGLYASHLKKAIEPNPIRISRGIEIVEGDRFVRDF